MEKSKYFFISRLKEETDIASLVSAIRSDGWIDKNTIIVNCFPDMSSYLVQVLNHKLSNLNRNELYEVIHMEMPYPITNQVWNPGKKIYQVFDIYLKEWIAQNIKTSFKYLFVEDSVVQGKSLNKIKLSIRPLTDTANYKFASVYVERNSIFKPDYFVQEFEQATQGGLLYSWENADNQNWNY